MINRQGHPTSSELLDTRDAAEEKRKLQKHFKRLDLVFFLVCTLVGVDTIGSAASKGAQGFTWLAILALFFFVPYALLTAELGSGFPQEGGPYLWTRMAFGRLAGAVCVVMYWLSNPIWIGGTLTVTAATATSAFLIPLKGGWTYLFALAFIWFTTLAASISFRIGRWVSSVGAWARVVLLTLFTGSVALYAQRRGLHGFTTRDFAPTYITFISVAPVLVFNYVGFELPSAAGDEMPDPQRDVPFAVARSAMGAVLLYGAPILCVLLVLPQKAVTGFGGFVDAIKAVFTVYGGHVAAGGAVSLTGAGKWFGAIAAMGFVVATISSGATWLMGANRALAVAAYDGAAPRALGIFSRRFGTPLVVNIASGALSTAVMVAAYKLSAGSASKYFSAALGLAISTTTISYLFVFPSLVKLRRSLPLVERPYRIPGGMAGVWICCLLATGGALLATVTTIWPGIGIGWFHTSGAADSALPQGFEGQRAIFEATQLAPLAFALLLGLIFYVFGAPARRRLAADAALGDSVIPERGA